MAQHDIKEAQGTYEGFITMAKVGTAISIAAAALVIILIT